MGQNNSKPKSGSAAPRENGTLTENGPRTVNGAPAGSNAPKEDGASTENVAPTHNNPLADNTPPKEHSVLPSEPGLAPSVQSVEPPVQSAEPPVPNIGPDDAVIAVMGLTGVGKSTFISHFCDTAVVGKDLKSCTSTISFHSASIEGRTVHLIDTPGFNDTNRTDVDILREIATWLERSYDADIKLAGIVYLHRIQDNRVGGSVARNISLFRELCGENGLSSVVLATTMWDTLPLPKAEERERELKTEDAFWGRLVQHGCAVLRQDDGAVSATSIIQHILNTRRPVTLQIQDEMAEGTPLHETGAGGVLEAELKEQQRVYEREMDRLRTLLEKVNAELASIQEERLREQSESDKRDRARDAEIKELKEGRMKDQSAIKELKEEMKRLNEEVKSTKQKQERTNAEYEDFTKKRNRRSLWDCLVM